MATRDSKGRFLPGHKKVGGRKKARKPRIGRASVRRQVGPRLADKSFYYDKRSTAEARKSKPSRSSGWGAAAARARGEGGYEEGAGSFIKKGGGYGGHRHGTKVGRRTASHGGKRYGISDAAWGKMTRREHKAAVDHWKMTHGPKLKVGQSKSFTTKKSNRKGTRYKTTITRIN